MKQAEDNKTIDMWETKVKTAELQGAALDWAVAKCEVGEDISEIDDPHFYSTDWAQGGPIIEHEMIATSRGGSYEEHFWMASLGFSEKRIYGPTPLIAAMRCYVASKLGDFIAIPEDFK
jgi:hypothetical protein